MANNTEGSIDLLKLQKSAIVTIKGKKCIIAPVEENDIFISVNEDLKPRAAYLGLSIIERKEPSQFGKTHYCKQTFSKEFRESHKAEMEQLSKVYLGDFKSFEFTAQNGAEKLENLPAIDAVVEDNTELPF